MPEPLGPVEGGFELETSPNGPVQSVQQTIISSSRGLTRKVHHKKSASDTFAFAAGRLFETTPPGLYNFYNDDVPEENKHQSMLHPSPLRLLVTAEHDQMQVRRSTSRSGRPGGRAKTETPLVTSKLLGWQTAGLSKFG
jgi:hypothetical protein